jgi:hypothetical protein
VIVAQILHGTLSPAAGVPALMLTALGAISLSALLLILVAPFGLQGVQMIRQSVFILLLADVDSHTGLCQRRSCLSREPTDRHGMVRRGTFGFDRSLRVIRARRRRIHRLVRFPV